MQLSSRGADADTAIAGERGGREEKGKHLLLLLFVLFAVLGRFLDDLLLIWD